MWSGSQRTRLVRMRSMRSQMPGPIGERELRKGGVFQISRPVIIIRELYVAWSFLWSETPRSGVPLEATLSDSAVFPSSGRLR
ncbi:hypothetical protein J6590_022461 [Homalodisca vitripennis]|nr:hypothetical protein J6590_022461 [Homalodisca vitripennis]